MRHAGKPGQKQPQARRDFARGPVGWHAFVVLSASCCLLAGLAGCETTAQDRARPFNEDGVYLFQHRDYGAARESFEEALRLQPKDPALLYNVGQCHDRQNNTTKAEAFYRQCLEQDVNHAPCRHALAVLWFRTGRAKEAEQLIEDWLTQDPKRADAYVEDGWRLRQEGELTQAQARLQQALDLDPHNVRGLTEMGLLYEVLQMPERAVVLYQRVLAEDPHQTDVAERLDLLRKNKIGNPLPD